MNKQNEIRVVKNEDGRGTTKVRVLSYSADSVLVVVVRADESDGKKFVVWARNLLPLS